MNSLTYVNKPGGPFFYESPVALGSTIVQPGCRILAHTYINSGRVWSGTYIGRYCSIGNDVTIGTGHHDMNQLSMSPWFNLAAPPSVKHIDGDVGVRVKIKNDVWIGDKAIIMSGVTIGNGAVIGAGAIVTKDVPDYAVVAGVPAKILRYRFNEETISRMLALRWWEFDDNVLKTFPLYNAHISLAQLEQLTKAERGIKPVSILKLD